MQDDQPSDSTDKTIVLKDEQETLNREIQKAKEHDACLIVIRGDSQGHRYFLTQAETIMGRDPNCDIPINDKSISRNHAKLSKRDGKIFLTDTKSSNGTLVNGKKIPPDQATPLSKEDMIRLGNTIFKFLPAGEYEILFYGDMDSKAYTDPLTQISNKRYLLERLDAEFKRAKTLQTDMSLVFFDLDHFKKINDTYGHEAGDYVLKELCALLRGKFVGPKDVFARYGGEEFVILCSNKDAASTATMGEAIRATTEAHAFIFESKRIAVTLSIGIADLSTTIESPQTLLRNADRAMYTSKQTGRNKVTVSG